MKLLDLDRSGKERKIRKEVSKRRMTWKNGVEMRTLSAEGQGEQLMGFGAGPSAKGFGELGLHRLQSQEQVKTLLLSHGFGPWQCGTKQDISVVSGYSTTCLASRNKGRPDQDNVLLMFGDTIHEHRDADSGIVRVDSVERVLLLARYARENDEVEAKFGDDNEPF